MRRKGAEAASYRVVYDEDVLEARKKKEKDGETSQKEEVGFFYANKPEQKINI